MYTKYSEESILNKSYNYVFLVINFIFTVIYLYLNILKIFAFVYITINVENADF